MKRLAIDIIENFPSRHGRGRPMLGVEAATLLMECVAETKGDYIEIGSAVGGSAIMAGMAMNKVNREGLIVCIDPFGFINEMNGVDIRLHSFWMNIDHYDLRQRVLAFKQTHPPFPMPIHFHEFSVGLIDGDHYEDSPYRDFANLNARVTNYIMFDNAEIEAVDYAINQALEEPWEVYKSIEYTSLIKKQCIYENDKRVKFTVLRRKD